jgi:hypothetical protein
MRFSYYRFIFLNAILLFFAQNAHACGYDWVGECSSSVHLRINGTLDSFAIADCPAGIRFQGQHLGTLQSLSLANARAITWESCQNNVSAVGLQYRVYEQGGGAGGFQNYPLDQDFFTVQADYTTRYRSKAGNVDLASGLIIGKTYVLEVYFLAEIDTIGDDFIPETTLLKNNGGQYYQLSFTYGGPTANPFVVIPSIVQAPKCHGENNGSIKISVWGEQTGLFYHWSNINLNFNQQNGLSAGTYTVTVTGANHTDSTTVILNQPEVLLAIFNNIQPVSCDGGAGNVTVLPSGGTLPYRYQWADGQTTATATFLNAGLYSVSVVDAYECFWTQAFEMPGSGSIQRSDTLAICAGDSLWVGSILINQGGEYILVLAGSNGCDTVLTLRVLELGLPIILITSQPASGPNVPDAALELALNGEGPFEIQWSNGETGSMLQNLLPGSYCVTVNGANACSVSDCVEIGFTSSTNELKDASIHLSPNPARPGEWLVLSLPLALDTSTVKLEFFDSHGKTFLLQNRVQVSGSLRVKLPESILSGAYFLRLCSESGHCLKKIHIIK